MLGVKNDCTKKEIRDAFVILSKAYHPDTKGSSDLKSHQDFIRLMEAYQVLSKSHSRANYDLSLRGISTVHYIQRDTTVYEPWKVDPTSYSEKAPFSPYYGIKGINRVSNWKIAMACLMFCAFGIMIQTVAISRSVTFKREQLDKSSAIYNSNHEKVQRDAEKYGNAAQLERVNQRLRKSLVYDKD